MSEPVDAVNTLGALWSEDFDRYASGEPSVRCVLCQHQPCDCPEFGTAEFFALMDRRHRR